MWPVSDQDTAKLMADFYRSAHQSGDAPKALAEVQRDWLVRLRQERGLSGSREDRRALHHEFAAVGQIVS